MAIPDINFIDPNGVQKVIKTADGTPDLILGTHGNPEQVHIHEHAEGQTISIKNGNTTLARITIPKPGLGNFGK